MKKHFAIIGLVTMYLLTSCAPRIATTVMKTYPALSPEDRVEVFTDKKTIPSESESLGIVKVGDTGFSNKCDSLTVIGHLQEEARKIGGNAVFVTEHIKPSIWGSSCHQIAATVLKIKDFSSVPSDTAQFAEETSAQEVKKLPRVRLLFGAGYGSRTAKTAEGLSPFEKSYVEDLKSGPIWDASFNYYFNNNYGIGLIYSAFTASNSVSATNTDTNISGDLDTRDLITYIGPSFVMRGASRNDKWFFDIGIGLGYLGYKENISFAGNTSKGTGSTVGFQSSIGGEYRISENWGIGVDLSALSGILNKINYNENGYKYTVEFDTNEGEGLGHIRILASIRYHIK